MPILDRSSAEAVEILPSEPHQRPAGEAAEVLRRRGVPVLWRNAKLTHRPFPALGPNMRRYLSAQKRMETMVQIRLLIKWEESTLSPSELDLIYTHPILRGEPLESNPPLRFAYAVLAHGVTGQFLVADTIFSFISAAG